MKKICVLAQDINAYILSLYLLKNNEVFKRRILGLVSYYSN